MPVPGHSTSSRSSARLDERQVAREQHHRPRIAERAHAREQRDQRARAGRILLHRGQAAHAEPDFDHGIAHGREHARRARRERLAVHDEPRLVGSHAPACATGEQHARHLAHAGYA